MIKIVGKLTKMKNNLVGKSGEPQFGVLGKAITDVNFLDFPLYSSMDKKLPEWRKRLRFNQFQFVGAMNETHIFGLAIVNLQLVSNLFFYLYSFKSKQLKEFSSIVPLGLGTDMSTRPDEGEAKFSAFNAEAIISCESGGQTRNLYARAKGAEVNLVLEAPAAFMPLRVCSGAGKNGWVYTQKAAGLRCQGKIVWDDEVIPFESAETSGSYDWSAGFMRRETFWNWASFSGMLHDGRRIGLNLATGVNESGVTENGFWVGDHFEKVDFVQFQFDRQDVNRPWRMISTDGKVNLTFFPEGIRQERLNVYFLASNFKQMFGKYEGYLKVNRHRIEIKDVPGFAEDHFARW